MSKHGMVKAVGKHFEYEDGTLYFPFGTTIYAFAHQTKDLIEQTFETLKKAPFNKVRMCVFPKYYLFNNNEPQWYPWAKNADGSWNVDVPVKEYWDNLDSIITRLDEMEIECDLVLFHSYDKWGFSSMPHEDDLKYLQFVIDRLGYHKNVWWSLANEYDFLLSVKPLEDWYDIEEYLAAHDSNHHLLSNHNCFEFWDVKRKNVTHGSYQTKRMGEIEEFVKESEKPIIIDECCYEGNIHRFWGNITGEEMAARFWQCIASGAYCTHGETFLDDNDVLWWAKGGILKGKSASRIAFLKNIMEEVGKPFEPYYGPKQKFSGLTEAEKAVFLVSTMMPSAAAARGLMSEHDSKAHAAAEHEYNVHTADDSAILKYYYVQCPALERLSLDENKKYKVELIDTWNMTRKVLAENASGFTELKLDGIPYQALLATEIK